MVNLRSILCLSSFLLLASAPPCFCQGFRSPATPGLTTRTLTGPGPELVWQATLATHTVGGNEQANAALVDHMGNSYITGNSSGLGTDIDFLTAKFDAGGNVVWTSRHDGPLHYRDEPTGIALDTAGNTYVSGLQNGMDNTLELTTIKLDPAGKEEWVRAYPFHGSHFYRTFVAVDNSGRVSSAVADFSWESGMFSIVAARYDSDGNEQWTQRVDSCAHVWSLATDAGGNLYLTCEYGYNGFLSMILKWDSSGKLVWKKRMPQMLYSSTLDPEGALAVTGGSTREFTSMLYVAKLSPEGAVLWFDQDTQYAATFGYGVACDSKGRVCVSARTGDGATNVIAVRYDSLGHRDWLTVYDKFSTNISTTALIAPAPNGDLFVGAETGTAYLLLRLGQDGAVLGTANLEGAAYAGGGCDDGGNFYAMGSCYDAANPGGYLDFASTKFSSLGERIRTSRYADHTNSYDVPSGALVDPESNILVYGYSLNGDSQVLSVWKTDPNGILLWHTSIVDTLAGFEECRGSQLDPGGNVIVLGDHHTIDNETRIILAGLNASGKVIWKKQLGTTASGYKRMPGVFTVDPQGYIFLTDFDFNTMKLDPQGNVVWTRHFSGSTSDDTPTATRVGSDGGVYVAGTSLGPEKYPEFVVVRYDSNGTPAWNTRYHVSSTQEEHLSAMVLDSASNVVCVGNTIGGRGPSSNPTDFLAIKVSPGGSLIWHSQTDTSMVDELTGAAFDSKGNIIAVGSTLQWGYLPDFALLKFSPQGELQWISAPLDFPGRNTDRPTSVYNDPSDNIFVLGNDIGMTSLVEYSPAGEPRWVLGYRGEYYGGSSAVAVLPDGGNALYAVEASSGSGNLQAQPFSVIHILKIAPGLTSAHNRSDGIGMLPSDLSLTCWPNPFNPATTISYSLPSSTGVRITICDVLGREVDRLVDGFREAGEHRITWTARQSPSGVYFLRIETERQSRSAKIILVK